MQWVGVEKRLLCSVQPGEPTICPDVACEYVAPAGGLAGHSALKA